MNRPRCKTCAYWIQWDRDNEEYGSCQRRPPTTTNGVYGPQWPDSHEDDWCGEHHLFPAYLASLSSGEVKDEEWYGFPNGDTIKMADVDYIKYRLSRMTDATSTLDRPILVVGLKSEPVIEGTYVEIHLKFDSDDAVINAYYALDSAVRAYRKSQPSQDPH